MALRNRFAALLLKISSSPGVFATPSASTDGVLVEAPTVSIQPQNTETNEVAGSLDGRGPIPGGFQCQITAKFYLKGSGVPGLAAEWGKFLRVCGMAETVTKTDITGTGISVDDASTIADTGSGLAALTVGTAIYVSGFADPANTKELLVATSSAGSITVTKPDGSAAGLVAEAAGASITIRRGIAGVAATAGTTTGFTAQSPWGNTAQLYRFMPVLLSGNPATPAFTFMSDYLATRVATITDLMGSALTTSTKVSVPANVIYVPASSSIPEGSLEVYKDGRRWRFAGVRGNAKFSFETAKACFVELTLSGMFVSIADAAIPAVTYDGTRPGTFRNSVMLMNRAQAATRMLGLDLGNQLTFPDNPNQTEGFDPPEITARKLMMTADPMATLIATRDLFGAFRAGTEHIIHARVLGGNAATYGQRFGITMPQVFYTQNNPGDRNGLETEQVEGFCRGEDCGAGLCVY